MNLYPFVPSDCWKAPRAGQSWTDTLRWNRKDADRQDQVHKTRKVWLKRSFSVFIFGKNKNIPCSTIYNYCIRFKNILSFSGWTWPAGYLSWSKRILMTTWTHRHQWALKAWRNGRVSTRKVSREVRYRHLPLGFGLKHSDVGIKPVLTLLFFRYQQGWG